MLAAFRRYDWPGNIRQLRNVVRTAMIVGEGPVLSLEGAEFLLTGPLPAPCAAPNEVPGTLRLRELERRAILEALERSQRNQAKAARLLGITDRTLREKLRRYRQAALVPAPAPAEANTVGEAIW
jgi:DNA-binding NtrC family response regulator